MIRNAEVIRTYEDGRLVVVIHQDNFPPVAFSQDPVDPTTFRREQVIDGQWKRA